MILRSLVLSQYQRVTDRQTDTPPIAKSRSGIAAERDENAGRVAYRVGHRGLTFSLVVLHQFMQRSSSLSVRDESLCLLC